MIDSCAVKVRLMVCGSQQALSAIWGLTSPFSRRCNGSSRSRPRLPDYYQVSTTHDWSQCGQSPTPRINGFVFLGHHLGSISVPALTPSVERVGKMADPDARKVLQLRSLGCTLFGPPSDHATPERCGDGAGFLCDPGQCEELLGEPNQRAVRVQAELRPYVGWSFLTKSR